MTDLIELPPRAKTGGQPTLTITISQLSDPVKRADIATRLYKCAMQATEPFRLIRDIRTDIGANWVTLDVSIVTIVTDSDEANEMMLYILQLMIQDLAS